MASKEEVKRFKTLVDCAEKYIDKQAQIVAYKHGAEKAMEVVKKNYSKPENIADINNGDKKLDMVIERFCIELQNYQAMPRAINYAYYGKDYENKIFKLVKKIKNDNLTAMEIYEKLRETCKFDEEKKIIEINEKLKEKIKNSIKENMQEKINYAWLRYSIGICDMLNFINHEQNFESLCKYIEKPKEKNGKLNTEILKGKIYYLGEVLTYDFFKELGRDDLMKPDIHMIKLMETVSKKDSLSENKTRKIFLECCRDKSVASSKKYTPYYIDKVLWLCCTGAFYKDDIICTNMSRKGLLEKFEEELNKNTLYN